LIEKHIAHLWGCMSMYFGYSWLNTYGEADNGTWLTGLHDIKPEQILAGIDACRKSGKQWPPTLPEFRKICMPAIVPPYHCRYQRLPTPRANPDIAAENLKQMKKALRR